MAGQRVSTQAAGRKFVQPVPLLLLRAKVDALPIQVQRRWGHVQARLHHLGNHVLFVHGFTTLVSSLEAMRSSMSKPSTVGPMRMTWLASST